jgi:hypothetical protein
MTKKINERKIEAQPTSPSPMPKYNYRETFSEDNFGGLVHRGEPKNEELDLSKVALNFS